MLYSGMPSAGYEKPTFFTEGTADTRVQGLGGDMELERRRTRDFDLDQFYEPQMKRLRILEWEVKQRKTLWDYPTVLPEPPKLSASSLKIAKTPVSLTLRSFVAPPAHGVIVSTEKTSELLIQQLSTLLGLIALENDDLTILAKKHNQFLKNYPSEIILADTPANKPWGRIMSEPIQWLSKAIVEVGKKTEQTPISPIYFAWLTIAEIRKNINQLSEDDREKVGNIKIPMVNLPDFVTGSIRTVVDDKVDLKGWFESTPFTIPFESKWLTFDFIAGVIVEIYTSLVSWGERFLFHHKELLTSLPRIEFVREQLSSITGFMNSPDDHFITNFFESFDGVAVALKKYILGTYDSISEKFLLDKRENTMDYLLAFAGAQRFIKVVEEFQSYFPINARFFFDELRKGQVGLPGTDWAKHYITAIKLFSTDPDDITRDKALQQVQPLVQLEKDWANQRAKRAEKPEELVQIPPEEYDDALMRIKNIIDILAVKFRFTRPKLDVPSPLPPSPPPKKVDISTELFNLVTATEVFFQPLLNWGTSTVGEGDNVNYVALNILMNDKLDGISIKNFRLLEDLYRSLLLKLQKTTFKNVTTHLELDRILSLFLEAKIIMSSHIDGFPDLTEKTLEVKTTQEIYQHIGKLYHRLGNLFSEEDINFLSSEGIFISDTGLQKIDDLKTNMKKVSWNYGLFSLLAFWFDLLQLKEELGLVTGTEEIGRLEDLVSTLNINIMAVSPTETSFKLEEEKGTRAQKEFIVEVKETWAHLGSMVTTVGTQLTSEIAEKKKKFTITAEMSVTSAQSPSLAIDDPYQNMVIRPIDMMDIEKNELFGVQPADTQAGQHNFGSPRKTRSMKKQQKKTRKK